MLRYKSCPEIVGKVAHGVIHTKNLDTKIMYNPPGTI